MQIVNKSAWRIALLGLVLICLSSTSVMADNRKNEQAPGILSGSRNVALVIGNTAYADDPLGNPINDARAMSTMLASLGFEVLRRENVTKQQMEEALHDFSQRLGTDGVALFYFAGHGFQIADATMLAPIDADRRSPVSLLTQSIDVQRVLHSLSRLRQGRPNLIILDTCLNNPFQTGTTHGQALPAQTLIAYATAPGSLADDGNHHGVYTAALLKALTIPGLDIREIFQGAASAVRQTSAQKQQPWIASSLPEPFRLSTRTQNNLPAMLVSASSEETTPNTRSRAILPKDSAEQYELAFWDSIKDSTYASDYEAYLKAYPNGRFAALARARIERLQATQPKAESPKRAAPATKAPPPSPKKEPPPQARPAPAAPPPTAAASGGVTGEEKDCPACPILIGFSPGSFTMGSNTGDLSEKPAHRVTVNAPFAMGKYEVTVEQWNACAEAGACPRLGTETTSTPNTPVRDVSWDDAQQYVKWLSKLTGKSYRLPTEAEWEYAARAGTSTRFWWGEKMQPGKANCKECGEPWSMEGPANVGSFAANPYGLYDMNGSVWEWVSDCWHNNYKGAPADGRSWEAPACRERVIRGGSWRDGASYMPSATRFKYAASVRHSQNGFRVVRDSK